MTLQPTFTTALTPLQPPTIHRLPRIAAMTNACNSDCSLIAIDEQNKIDAFLAKYAPMCDIHCLLSVPLACFTAQLSVNNVLAALSSGDTEPLLDDNNDSA